MFQLCAYPEALQMLNLFTKDGETFPASDLLPNVRTTIIHACGLCLRFEDHLNQAYRQEKIAWQRSVDSDAKPHLAPDSRQFAEVAPYIR